MKKEIELVEPMPSKYSQCGQCGKPLYRDELVQGHYHPILGEESTGGLSSRLACSPKCTEQFYKEFNERFKQQKG